LDLITFIEIQSTELGPEGIDSIRIKWMRFSKTIFGKFFSKENRCLAH
jgi:hypothetical protein